MSTSLHVPETPFERVGNYVITSHLATGGMGTVSVGINPVTGRCVAIKRPLTRDDEVLARFENEARAMGILHHENIVDVLDYGIQSNGVPYTVMEYLDGRTLRALIEDRRALSLPEALAIICPVSTAVQHMHDAGVIHRDLKPDNILLARDPRRAGAEVVKIIDFGIARVEPFRGPGTLAGMLMGSPLYMAPEQVQASPNVDARCDIYAMALILFELLVGRSPFDGQSIIEAMIKRVSADAPRLSSLLPSIPKAIDTAVARALSREPNARQPSAAAFGRELEVARSQLV